MSFVKASISGISKRPIPSSRPSVRAGPCERRLRRWLNHEVAKALPQVLREMELQ
jgi:hypothetical protein